MGKYGGRLCASVWVLLFVVACDSGVTADTSHPKKRAAPIEAQPEGSRRPAQTDEVDDDRLLIGEYRLSEHPVIDGDTIRVEGIEGSVRLLSLDTEEPFDGAAQRIAAAENFEQYMERARAKATRYPKPGTPMGEKATEFATAFFEGARIVRLKHDDPKEVRGSFGRLLAYAFVEKEGRWINYSLECVRAGMSPYFTKYGYSRQFHDQLSQAEAEARESERGIWSPSAKGYGDYEERKAWWNARADFIREFEAKADGRKDHVQLSHEDATDKLEALLGQEATVLSTVEDIRHFKSLVRVTLAFRRHRDFPLIFFDRDVFAKTRVARFDGEPVVVRGRIERYRKGTYATLQIVVEDPTQVSLPVLPHAN